MSKFSVPCFNGPRSHTSVLCSALFVLAVLMIAAPTYAQRWGVSYSRGAGPSYGLSSGYSLNSYSPPSVVSGSGRYYGQYSPALANAGYYGTIYDDARYYSAYRPQYAVPSRYLTYNGPGSLSRLYYYGGLYRTPTRLYSGGSRLYGSRYNTYTSPYGANRPSGGSIIYFPQRVSPRIRYRFVQ